MNTRLRSRQRSRSESSPKPTRSIIVACTLSLGIFASESFGQKINLRLGLGDVVYFHASGDVVAFSVCEGGQGSTDLNGDGDAFDDVLHVYHGGTRSIANLGLALSTDDKLDRDSVVRLDGPRLIFEVAEADQGNTDLNGDGDTDDYVYHTFDANRSHVKNLGLAGNSEEDGFARVSGDLVFFPVSERDQGNTDLNGDGDSTDDFILHRFDPLSNTVSNIGYSTRSFEIGDDSVYFSVSEAQQGNTDLNDDGDTMDVVLHTLDVGPATVINLGTDATNLEVDGKRVVFAAREWAQGAQDLNGDGDTNDDVLVTYDHASGVLRSPNRSTSRIHSIRGNRVIFGVNEADEGIDLNGDRDLSDHVAHVFSTIDGSTLNLGIHAAGFRFMGENNDRFFFKTCEWSQGNRDLNGDGDADDCVLHAYEISTQTLTNSGLAAGSTPSIGSASDTAFFHLVSEEDQGTTDLNGDGDVSDQVLHVIDANGTENTFAAVSSLRTAGHVAVLQVRESSQGNTDLNLDGDSSDTIAYLYDPRETFSAMFGPSTNLGPVSGFHWVTDRLVALRVPEFNVGADLNGDSDLGDSVLHIFHPCGLGFVNLGAGPVSSPLTVNGNEGYVEIGTGEEISVSLNTSPAGPALAQYILWIWAGPPRNKQRVDFGQDRSECVNLFETPPQRI